MKYIRVHFSDGVCFKNLYYGLKSEKTLSEDQVDMVAHNIIEDAAYDDPFEHVTFPNPDAYSDLAEYNDACSEITNMYIDDCYFYSYWDEVPPNASDEWELLWV